MIACQMKQFCQDMYQAAYASYVIDCGYYEHIEDGNFLAYLIEDYDWDHPDTYPQFRRS